MFEILITISVGFQSVALQWKQRYDTMTECNAAVLRVSDAFDPPPGTRMGFNCYLVRK